jgi:hypothetical protein
MGDVQMAWCARSPSGNLFYPSLSALAKYSRAHMDTIFIPHGGWNAAFKRGWRVVRVELREVSP